MAVPERSVTRASRFLLVVLLAVGLAGCGVSASNSPIDEGDAAAGGTTVTDTEIPPLPSPNTAGTADRLVEDFLMAASGGGPAASEQVKPFLTDTAKAAWPRGQVNPESPSLTIIRTIHGPTVGAPVNGRTPVTVAYQEVGTLRDQGRIEELADLSTVGTMLFWVVREAPTSTNLRVDEISGEPPGLFLSDKALMKYYRIQPIYFWDQAYTALVPDVRYVPLTITPDSRATTVVRWLVAGPSSWLGGAPQRLPPYVTGDPVQSDNGTLVVKLSPQAADPEPDGLRRLMLQLQWSLRTPNNPRPPVALSIDGTMHEVATSEQEYLQSNLGTAFDQAPQRYDITAADPKVVPVPEGPTATAVLGAPENANVVSAAIGGGGTVAAFVRTSGNSRRLQIVREGVGGPLNPPLQSPLLGRPVFVPGATEVLLIATGGQFGKLYRVSTVDASVADVTPRPLTGVTAVSVSPDGRRVALIAGGQAYVSSLSVANGSVAVGSSPRPILANQLTSTALVWTDETWLLVAGTSSGAPAMWRVTADSVVAENVSGSLLGLRVDDLVAYPKGPGPGSSEVLATTQSGIVYTYFRQLTPPEQSIRFFGTP